MNQYFFKMSKAERENILDKHKSVYDGYVTEFGKTNNQQPLYVQDLANDKNGITVSNTGNVKHYTNMNINEGHTGLDKIADGPHDLENGTVDFRGVPDMSDVNREYFHDDYPSPNEDEEEYISLGFFDDANDDWSDENESRYDDRVNYGIDDESAYTDNDDWDDEDEELKEFNFFKRKMSSDDIESADGDYYLECGNCHGDGCESCDFEGRVLDNDFNINDFEGYIDEDELPEFIDNLNESLDMFRRIIK